MGPLNLVLLFLGIVLIGIGWARARGPWVRYRALRAQDQNIARYEAWRGGVRGPSSTGASVAMEILRRQVRTGAGVAVAGCVLAVLGFLLK